MFSVGIIDLFIQSFVSDKISKLFYGNVLTFKFFLRQNFFIKDFNYDLKSFYKSKIWGGLLEKRSFFWGGVWDDKGFIALSDSKFFLRTVKTKIEKLLLEWDSQTKIARIEIIWVKAYAFFYKSDYFFVFRIGARYVKKELFHVKNSMQRFKLFAYSPLIYLNGLKKNLNIYFIAGQNYSAYSLILILNVILKEWADYSLLYFQEMESFLKYWLHQQFLFWVRRKHPKNFRILFNTQYLMMKYRRFQNHFEILNYITKIKGAYMIEKNSGSFFGLVKKRPGKFDFVIPRIHAVLGLYFFQKV
jgi:hypothetical protein